jgi:hypothetical protein
MRTIKGWHITFACVICYTTTLPLFAQQADAPQPPRLEKLEEGEAPAVTIRPPGQERRMTEKRAPGGKVTEVQVTSGKSTYYLKPNDQPGSAVVGDTQSHSMRAPQWEVQTFDLGLEAAKEQAAQADVNAPAPPPRREPAKK